MTVHPCATGAFELRHPGGCGLFNAYGVEHIADVACGTGFHSVKLARSGFTVTSTDGARAMVEQTRSNAREHGVALHDLRCVDWLKLKDEFGEGAFDAVICLGNAFTHLFEHEARRDTLAAVYATLKPGGLVIIDHRNYDSILDQGYSSKHRYYYTGKSVEVEPVQISRTLVKFRYAFDNGETHHLTLYPLKQQYMSHLLEDAGFMDVTRYGDFERPYDHYDPDFIQQVGFKPRKPIRHTGPADKLNLTQRFVAATKRYYDGAADQIYRDIWGENIHLGLFENENEDLPTAMVCSNRRMAEGVGLGTGHEVLEVGCGNVAPTYGWVRGQLEKRRSEFEDRIGKELVDRTSRALQFWVDRAGEGYIGWLYVVARK